MEQPPGSIDDLQPQDLSTSSIPTVIDLTRKGEECVLSSTSLDALRMVKKSPGWYGPNSSTSSNTPGLQFSETSSSSEVTTLQSGDKIQPDNALSHTTVTLSYVSRSHVFSTHDSLSGHSPLHGVPPISRFSLHPPCDADKGLVEYSHNQRPLEQEDPVDLVTQTELLLSQAQVGPGEGCPEPPHELNGGVIPESPLQEKEEHNISCGKGQTLENGQGDCWSSSGVRCAESSSPGEDKGGSEVLFLTSKEPGPAVISDRDLCSLNRDYISPLEDPISPSATSLDDVEDVFVLPQASSSPSGDTSYLEAAEDVTSDGLRTEGAIQPNSNISDGSVKLETRNVTKQSANRRKAVLEPLIDLTEDVCVSDVLENEAKPVIPHINGNAKVLERTLKEKKLPSRSGRGVRLETIVMNINSSKYNVSGCIRTNKKANASQSAATDSTTDKTTDSEGNRKGKEKAALSVKTIKQKTPVKRGKTSNINTDSTSDSEINNSKTSHCSSPPKTPPLAVHTKSKKEATNVCSPPQTSPEKSKRRRSSSPHENSQKEPEQNDPSEETPPQSPSKSPKTSKGKAKSKAAGSKQSPTAKTKAAHTPKQKKKKRKQGQSSSSMFSPKEPEIKLKYVNYKEEKRDLRVDSFSPFIRVERQQASPSLCTVINYPEEVRTQHKKGQQQPAHTTGFISAVVPSTSCLQLGRASMHSQHQRSLVCCLCGHSANAMDLGDLHGPYYPEGYQPSTKTPASTSGLKEEDDYSDSDSSSCSVRGRGRKRAAPPTPWALRPGGQLKKKGLLESQRWTGDGTNSPAAKHPRCEAGPSDVEDWYSPPVLPLEPCEYWLHEDCGIWSAGVFLVKGKVYGLEEAVKVAQETTCSACQDQGATLGCFFKGCPNKYHYRCALESDCVLIEENFSMKCKKHKNKTFKAPPGNRLDDR